MLITPIVSTFGLKSGEAAARDGDEPASLALRVSKVSAEMTLAGGADDDWIKGFHGQRAAPSTIRTDRPIRAPARKRPVLP